METTLRQINNFIPLLKCRYKIGSPLQLAIIFEVLERPNELNQKYFVSKYLSNTSTVSRDLKVLENQGVIETDATLGIREQRFLFKPSKELTRTWNQAKSL